MSRTDLTNEKAGISGSTRLARISSPGQPSDECEIKVTQESIAHAVGLSRETVNKHLKELAEAQIIEMSRGAI